MLQELLVKRANRIMREKQAFQPMPGGQPPADPNAQPPMDPSMMGGGAPGGMPPGGAGMPMDPSMMQGGGMPMDPSMMGGMPPGMGMGMGAPMPATVGQLSVTDFQTIMTDMLGSVLQQIMGALGGGGAGAGPAGPAGAPPELAPQSDIKTVSNTEISEKLDALLSLLSGTTGAGAGAPPGMGMGMGMEGGPEMGFGGQSIGAQPPATGAGGMEVQGSVQKKHSLADMILSKTSKARRQE